MKINVQREKAALTRIRKAINLRSFTEDKKTKLLLQLPLRSPCYVFIFPSTDGRIKYNLTLQGAARQRYLLS